MSDYDTLRRWMVDEQLERRGISDPLVLDAMASVPREAFVPPELRAEAYADGPLPIGESQTISQPFIVALMIEALELTGGERVLEVGGGSGYAAAVLARIAEEVYSVERHRSLADQAAARLRELGVENVEVICADGTRGWPERAPYDAIVVAAGAPVVPRPLEEQLAVGGRLVIPVGGVRTVQELLRVTRISETEYRREKLTDVRFVPLVGEQGWEW
jgi:protein-L-isoaspartate(D-aspartate) O-methyltransferase